MRSYREKEALKRNLIALGSTLLLYGMLFLLLFLWENRRTDLDLYSGPMLVTLGAPEGEDVVEEGKAPSPQASQEAQKENPPEPDIAEQSAVEEVRPTPAEPQTPPEEKASEQSAAEQGSTAQGDAAEEEEAGRIVKGQSYGNTHELYMDYSGGRAGRNLWVPVHLYMPLPQILNPVYVEESQGDTSLGIYPEDDRRLLKQYYQKVGSSYHLEPEIVPLDNRPDIWLALERSGYSLSQAPYKTEMVLRPVELHFSIAAADGASGNPQLLELKVAKSSGIEAIDQAVLYAFTQSSYYNNSDRDLKGRFLYRFQ